MAFRPVSPGPKEVFESFKKHCYSPKEACPRCGHHTLLQPGPINARTGKPDVPPVCFHCGYCFPIKGYEQKNLQAMQQYRMRRKSALIYFKDYSIYPSIEDLHNETFYSFKTPNYHLKNIKKQALKVARTLIINNNSNIHVLLDGNTGVGKTHLANAIINEIWRKTSFKKKIMFINVFQAVQYQQKAIHDEPTQEFLDGILKQIGKADLVVLDDLGRERKTEWNQLLVDDVANSREHKPVLITSNLTNANRYPEQTRDRLFAHCQTIDFVGIPSYRTR